MSGTRRAEVICGIAAAVYGCGVTAAIAVAIKNDTIPADTSGALFFMALGFAAFLAVGLGAVLHALGSVPVGIALLWPGSVIVALLTYLGIFSIGIIILPGTALAAAASITALVRISSDPRLSPGPGALGWVELLAGTASPVAVVAGLDLLLYWASIYYVSPDKGGYFSRADLNGIATTLPLFLGGTLLGLLVAIGAAMHAIARSSAGRVLLWLATLLLVAATVLAFAGINAVRYLPLAGPYLLPALILAAVAAVASLVPTTRTHATPTPALA